MKVSTNEIELIIDSIEKNIASTNRLIKASKHEGARKFYEQYLVLITNLKNKIKTGQGALTL